MYNLDIGPYVTASKQIGLLNKLASISNNSANSTTAGYQEDKVLFYSHIHNMNEKNVKLVNDIGAYRNVESGGINLTGNPLDLAIQGAGYFAVQTPAGIRYRRSGDFTINNDGNVATHEGFLVLDQGGQPIVIPPEAGDIIVDKNGVLLVDGEEAGILGIASFTNPQQLVKRGYNNYEALEAPTNDQPFTVVQGALEESNVNINLALTELIDTQRAIEMGVNLINDFDEVISRTIRVYAQDGES